jgi:hypothetical protein
MFAQAFHDSMTLLSTNAEPIRDRLAERPTPSGSLPGDRSNRRAHVRWTVSELPWLREVRLKYGPAVSLIDLSPSGIQIETMSYRLQPGTLVVVEISGKDIDWAIPARVVRCRVSGLVPHASYRGALVFKQPLRLPAPAPDAKLRGADANPLHEHARLHLALRRLGEAGAAAGRPRPSLTRVGTDAMASALTLIESPAGRRAGAPFTRELSRLFQLTTRGLENAVTADALLADISERLRRAVPARAIRLAPCADPPRAESADAIYFDIPSQPGGGRRLLVEFPAGCRLEDWHMQLLKAAAHLIGVVQDVRHEIAPAAAPAVEEAPRAGVCRWSRVVVRYMDGRLLKGFNHDFTPLRGHIQVSPAPDAPLATRITTPLAHLKAIFFVRDFDGSPAFTLSRMAGTPSVAGRRIVVTFLDGEALEGWTLNYTTDGPGFFVSPMESDSNNERVFVIGGAVRHVQFP